MKFRLLLIGFSLFIFGSCTKEDDIVKTDDTSNAENNKIALVYPVNLQDLNPCCINFQWNNPEAGNSRILVSKNPNFTELIFDTLIASNSFTLKDYLQPNTEYFWKVSNSTSESQSTFKIKDVLSSLKPSYSNIKIRRYSWDNIQGIWKDTTFYDTIKLTKEGEKIRFEYAKDNINRLHQVYQFRYAPNTVFYLSEFNSQSSGSDLTINYLNDSIFINNRTGGMGGGTVWQLKLKK